MSKNYQIDFNVLVVQLLPTMLRKSKMIAWLYVLITPINTLRDRCMKHRRISLYKLGHNGQVCYLRKALNDAFDSSQRRIEIVDNKRATPRYIYTDGEDKPNHLGTMHLLEDADYSDLGVDFKVLLPRTIWELHAKEIAIGEYRFYEVEALLNFYKLASKRYKIELKHG